MKKTIIILIVLLLASTLIFIYWWQRGDALLVQPPSDFQGRGGGSVNDENISPLTLQSESQIKETIKFFMDNPNLSVEYVTNRKNPSNFTVGKVTPIDDNLPGVTGAWRTDVPPEWERPVYIFQQTEYINELCEVYEYEVDVRNSQIVEVHVRYPESIQNLSLDERKKQCGSLSSLYGPVVTEEEIKTVTMDYLARAVSDFDQIKDQFEYRPSTKTPVNIAAAHEWIWQDTDYKLPEGLSGDVYNYPTIRIIISSGGKLIYYFNSVGLFKN